MSYFIDRIQPDELEASVSPLTVIQWQEVDERRKSSEINVQWDSYRAMMDMGKNHWLGVYTDKAELVGYISFFLTESLHTGELTALTDTTYVLKEYRGGNVGKALISNAMDMAKALGAKHFMSTFKNGVDHEQITKDLGLFNYETVYCKAL